MNGQGDSWPVGMTKELERLAKCWESLDSTVNQIRIDVGKIEAKLDAETITDDIHELQVAIFGDGAQKGVITCNHLLKQSNTRLWWFVSIITAAGIGFVFWLVKWGLTHYHSGGVSP